MIRMKKFVPILLTMALMASTFAATAFASDGGLLENEQAVVPRGAECTNCEFGEMFQAPTRYGDWAVVDKTSCTHGDFWGWDEVQERPVFITYTCGSCGVSNTYTVTEQRIVHHSS